CSRWYRCWYAGPEGLANTDAGRIPTLTSPGLPRFGQRRCNTRRGFRAIGAVAPGRRRRRRFHAELQVIRLDVAPGPPAGAAADDEQPEAALPVLTPATGPQGHSH